VQRLLQLPLHRAAGVRNAKAVRLLLAAAPDTAMARSDSGLIPLQLAAAVRPSNETAKLLLAACPASTILTFLAARPCLAAVCAVDFVCVHLPLTDDQWEQLRQAYSHGFRQTSYVPYSILPHSPAQALPAALDHSPAQARQLVRLLTDTKTACLRTFGLCLARLQRRLRVPLPGPLAGKLMALFDA